MDKFDFAVNVVLENEGADFTNDPTDPGGATRRGITLNLYRFYKSDATEQDIRNLSRDQAIRIYRLAFWDQAPFDKITSYRLATAVFDFACHSGIPQAIKTLQRASNELESDIVVDGKLGEATLSAVNGLDQVSLLAEFRYERANFYKDLVIAKPELTKFLKGWIRRAMHT